VTYLEFAEIVERSGTDKNPIAKKTAKNPDDTAALTLSARVIDAFCVPGAPPDTPRKYIR
jgi:hypothetical protein